MEIKPWTRVVKLHPDVESESTSIATYAIDLGALVTKDTSVAPTYRDAYSFFRATHLTQSMAGLIAEVCDRLAGKAGNRVLQLRSPFGGGKSHTLAALYYAVKENEALQKAVPDMRILPQLGEVRVAVFDGEKFDAVSGKQVGNQRIRTMWGWIAWQLDAYDFLKEHDEKRIAPGGELLAKMLKDKPVLILLDEVSRYLERTMAERIGESTLYRQALEFIQTLTTEVAGSTTACLVYSLQASAREFLGNVEVLSTLDHLTSRVDAKREPIIEDEIFPVLRKRLLSEPPPGEVVNRVADIYTDTIRKDVLSYVSSEAERRELEERIIKYRERFVMAYPFHPALIDLMRERWASIPDFQRTRGVLRFLATALRILKKRDVADLLLSPNDIPLDEPEVRSAFFTEVGQREPYQAVLDADFIGANATIRRIDKLFKDTRQPATRIATSILMYSFGGQPKIEGKEGETLPPGVTENDLMLATLSPDLDSTTTKAILRDLVNKCLYIHYDGARYAFKTTPNVNKALEDEANEISRKGDAEVKGEIKRLLEQNLGGKPAVIWPYQSRDISDKEARFLIAYLPFEFAYEKNREKAGLELLTQYGDKPRIYKNSLALGIPDKDQIQPLSRAIRYLIAIDRVRAKKKSLNLTEEQLEQLKERERAEKAARDSSLKGLYPCVWLLRMENGNFALEPLEIGGRALEATNIHDRLMELLMRVHRKVFDTLVPKQITGLVKVEHGIELSSITEAFFSTLGFPRVVDEGVVKRAISKGIEQGVFGLISKEKVQIVKDRPILSPEQVVINKVVPEDEIDISSGYLVPSDALPKLEQEAPVVPVVTPPQPIEAEKPKPGKRISHIRYSLKVNRTQLYKCFNALGKLADKAGELSLSVEAYLKEGADPNWIRNAVEEPIEEAGVELKDVERA